jgi:hypothetical protein
MSAKFRLDDRVKRVGEDQVRSVVRVLEFGGEEPTYVVQIGSNPSTREWAKESELEKA